MKKIILAMLVCVSFIAQSLLATKLLFCHGFGASQRQARHYVNYHCCEPILFDFPEVSSPALGNLGQEADIYALDLVYLNCVTNEAPVVMGVSRGASVTLNWLNKKNRPVVAVVLESPFAAIQDTINHRVNSWYVACWLPYISRLLHRFVFHYLWAPSYSPSGIQPIDNLENISKDTPIFLYTSHQDELIPAYSTMKLYKKLKELGHTKVHILIVDHGEHANIIRDVDAERCLHVIHAFYKHYGLPHNTDYAALGLHDFAATQPSIEQITADMPQASWWHRIDV